MTNVRQKRRLRVSTTNCPQNPYTGATTLYQAIDGFVMFDTPYVWRPSGTLPPSHYTYCAKYSPVDGHALALGEIITIMGLDQDDNDVQVDFIAAIWPSIVFWDTALNGKFDGIETTFSTHADGYRSAGVTWEEWSTGRFFHSCCHRVSRAFYNPPAPPTAHYVQYPNIFGQSTDFHINGKWGMYDCRAIDIPQDSRYVVIPTGILQLGVKANYDVATGTDIRSGGEPTVLQVQATVVAPEGLISESAVGNMPAAFLLAMDPMPDLGFDLYSPAPLDLSEAKVSMLIGNASYDMQTGDALTNDGMITTVSDPERTNTVTWNINEEGPVAVYDPSRGPDVSFSPAPVGQTLDITGTGYGTFSFHINGEPVDQVDTYRAGVMGPFSGPAEGDTMHVTVGVDGNATVVGVTGQTQVDGVVKGASLYDYPEANEVQVQSPEEITEDPTSTPSSEAMTTGYAGQADDEGAAGDGGDNNGSGEGNFGGGGGNGSGGNGEGGDGADGDGGGEGAE